MDTFLLLLLIIAAPGACDASSSLRRYFIYYEQKTMPEALKFCREKHTDLVSIHSQEELNELWRTVDRSRMASSGNRAWIGLYDDVDSWRWSLSDASFYGNKEDEFRRWAPGEPNNKYGEEHCGLMNDEGSWKDGNCRAYIKGMCCDVSGLNVTFVPTPTAMTWAEAQSYCREHHTDLASVRNQAENQMVQEAKTSAEVWIGLYRELWKWTDGSDASFFTWRGVEPNNYYGRETCAAEDFKSPHGWGDWLCDQKYAFICYQRGVKQQVIRLNVKTKTSSLNLNDVAVLDQVLEQLKQKLKNEGLDENVALSWRKKPSGIVFQKQESEKETEPER